MHNCDVLVHDDSTVDDLIDVIEGISINLNRKSEVRKMFVLLQQDRHHLHVRSQHDRLATQHGCDQLQHETQLRWITREDLGKVRPRESLHQTSPRTTRFW